MQAPPDPIRLPLSRFEWGIILLICLMLFVKVGQGKWPVSDARVYVRAAESLLAGEPLYQKPDRYEFYRFKYPPTAALFFVPLTLLPFWATRVLMALLIGGSLLMILRIMEAWGPPADHAKSRLLIFLTFGGMIHYEFHLGQITLFLIAVLLKIAEWLDQKRDGLAAMVFSLTLHLKPFGWPLLLWGAFRSRNEFLVKTIVFFIFLGALTVPFLGIQGTLDNWKGFATEMGLLASTEVERKQPGLVSFGAAVDNWTHFSTRLPATWKTWSIAGVNFTPILLLFLFLWARVPVEAGDPKREIAWLLATIPLAGPSEYKYFQFLIPITWLGLAWWPEMPATRRALFIGGMIGLGINIYDLWGRTISQILVDWNVVTLGAFFLFWTGFQSSLRPNIGSVEAEKQMAARLGWISRPDRQTASAYSLLLLVALAVLAGGAYYQMQSRTLCRFCDEESAPGTKECKNCGGREIVPYPQRVKERERMASARQRFEELVARGDGAGAATVQALSKVQSEFSDIPPSDWKKLLKQFGK